MLPARISADAHAARARLGTSSMRLAWAFRQLRRPSPVRKVRRLPAFDQWPSLRRRSSTVLLQRASSVDWLALCGCARVSSVVARLWPGCLCLHEPVTLMLRTLSCDRNLLEKPASASLDASDVVKTSATRDRTLTASVASSGPARPATHASGRSKVRLVTLPGISARRSDRNAR